MAYVWSPSSITMARWSQPSSSMYLRFQFAIAPLRVAWLCASAPQSPHRIQAGMLVGAAYFDFTCSAKWAPLYCFAHISFSSCHAQQGQSRGTRYARPSSPTIFTALRIDIENSPTIPHYFTNHLLRFLLSPLQAFQIPVFCRQSTILARFKLLMNIHD